MNTLLGITASAFAATLLLFWALFFLVVLPRIHERGLHVRHRSRFGFLVVKWPFEEMEVYIGSLDVAERAKWYNRFLARAELFALLAFSAFALSMLAPIFV